MARQVKGPVAFLGVDGLKGQMGQRSQKLLCTQCPCRVVAVSSRSTSLRVGKGMKLHGGHWQVRQ